MTTQTQVGDNSHISKKEITDRSQVLGGAAALGAFIGAGTPLAEQGSLVDIVLGGATGIAKAGGFVLAVTFAGAGAAWAGGKLADIFGLEANSSTRKFMVDWSDGLACAGAAIAGVGLVAGKGLPWLALPFGMAAAPMVLGSFFAGTEKLIEWGMNGLNHLAKKQESPSPSP